MTSGSSSKKSRLPVPEIIDNNFRLSRKEPRKRNENLRAKKPPKLNTKFHDTSLNRSLNSSVAHAISFKENGTEDGLPLSPMYKKDKSLSYYDQCFDTISKIGEGSFGEVFKVRSREDGLLYAVKKSKQFFRSEKYREERLEEVKRYEQFSEHEHCVTLHRAWEQDDRLFMQMELCRGNLEDYIIEKKHLPEATVWSILLDILLALKALHDRNLIHLDIKLDNILIGDDGLYKLADFGLVVDVNHANMCQATEGDSRYIAPELMQGHFSKAADIFSLGIAALELSCNLDLPSNGPLWQQLRCGIFPEDLRAISPELQKVIISMMCPNPFERPTVDQLLSHNRLQSIQKHRRRFSIFRKMKYSIQKSKKYFLTKMCNLKNYFYHIITTILIACKVKHSITEHSFDNLPTDFYTTEFPHSPKINSLSSYYYSDKIANSTPLNYHSTSFRKSRKDVPRISFCCDSSDADEFNTSTEYYENEHIPLMESSSLICKQLFKSDDSD